MNSGLDVTLRIAQKADQDCMDMLMQFYHYDASEWISLDVTPNGRYAIRSTDRFWQGVEQFPFLILIDNSIAGFAVVDKEVTSADSDFNVGYLFILRRYRGRGAGRIVAHKLFTQFRGSWEVYQVEQNLDAIDFWRRVIDDFTAGTFDERMMEIDGRNSVQQRFRS